MICPDCKEKNQLGKFCSECGCRLKEKCPEYKIEDHLGTFHKKHGYQIHSSCPSIVEIEHELCKTRLDEAKLELRKRSFTIWRFVAGILFATFFITCAIVTTIPADKIFTLKYLPLLSFYYITLVLMFCATSEWNISARKRAEDKFLRDNPEYAKILKKGGTEI